MKPRGISILDILIGIALFGTLLALLFPSLLRARESVRRNQCSDNLRHYVVALHQYHDMHFSFPAATGVLLDRATDTIRRDYGTTFFLLPYLGEGARYASIVSDEHIPDVAADDHRLQGTLSMLLCPSDGNAYLPGIVNKTARSNIMTSRSDVAFHNNAGCYDIEYNNRNGTYAEAGLNRSVFHPVLGLLGEEMLHTWKSKDEITAGLGNTIAVSESVSAVSHQSRQIRGGVATFIMINSPSPLPPSNCLAHTIDHKHPLLLAHDLEISRSARGNVFTDGSPARSGFTTILAPNSPSCNNRMNAWETPERGWGIFSTSSHHIGKGVNVAFFDGSVHFVSEKIDTGDLYAPQPKYKHEPSPYGVWGAMGFPYAIEPLLQP